MDIVARVKGILIDPKAEWRVIEREPDDAASLLKNYVAILAAIPAVCGFIGASIIGVAGYRTGFFVGIASAVGGYILTFIGVYVMAFVIDALADMFGGAKSFANAFKVAAYAPTAAWIASVFAAIPVLSVLTVLGLYTLYLLYTGLPLLMKVPEERALGYLLAVVVCAIIVWALILFVPAMLFGVRPVW
jgi:Yip1 domain